MIVNVPAEMPPEVKPASPRTAGVMAIVVGAARMHAMSAAASLGCILIQITTSVSDCGKMLFCRVDESCALLLDLLDEGSTHKRGPNVF
jgi:hypothetical protein